MFDGAQCTKHGLPLGSSGQCARCRTGREDSWAPLVMATILFTFAALAMGAGFWISHKERPKPWVARLMQLPKGLGRPASSHPKFPAHPDPSEPPGRPSCPPEEIQVRPIVLYSTRSCVSCAAARKWLKSHDYSFVEHDIHVDRDARRHHRRLSPKGRLPTLEVDGKVLEGFRPKTLDTAILQAKARRSLQQGK